MRRSYSSAAKGEHSGVRGAPLPPVAQANPVPPSYESALQFPALGDAAEPEGDTSKSACAPPPPASPPAATPMPVAPMLDSVKMDGAQPQLHSSATAHIETLREELAPLHGDTCKLPDDSSADDMNCSPTDGLETDQCNSLSRGGSTTSIYSYDSLNDDFPRDAVPSPGAGAKHRHHTSSGDSESTTGRDRLHKKARIVLTEQDAQPMIQE